MGLSCSRTEQLVEDLLDDALDEALREELDGHLRECPGCRHFCRGAATVREVLAAEEPVYPSSAAMRRMWSGLERRIAAEAELDRAPERVRRSRVLAVGAAAALALAALGAVVLSRSGPEPERAGALGPSAAGPTAEAARDEAAAPSAPAPAVFARVVESSGEAVIERAGASHPLGEGSRLLPGDRVVTRAGGLATLSVGEDLRLALAPSSALELTGPAGGADRSVRLEEGWLACELDPERRQGGLEVRAGSVVVHVTGTVFAVDASEPGELEVRVSRGGVVVRGERDSEVAISEGQRSRFPSGRIRPLAAEAARRDEALLRGELAVEPVRTAPASPGELFAQAEAARSRSDYAAAARAYRRIAALDRGGPAGGTALVSLGQICLGPRGRPAEARQAFRDYLSLHRSGPMRQEAFVGLMRAEAALGHDREAREVARRYLAVFPSGRYADRARELLGTD